MSTWRRVATEKFPDFREEVEGSESLGVLWVELYSHFLRAHEEPVNHKLIRCCYDYAWWCLNESRNIDVAAKVGMGFYENLPKDRVARERMAEHLTFQDFNKVAPYCSYFLSPADFSLFCEEFRQRRDEIEKKRRKRGRKAGGAHPPSVIR